MNDNQATSSNQIAVTATACTSPKKSRCLTLVIGTGLSIALFASPGAAFIPGGVDLSEILGGISLPDVFDDIVNDVTQRIPVVGGILKDVLGSLKCDLFGCSIEAGGSVGEEDIPNPYEIRAESTSQQSSNPEGDILSINPTVRARDLSNLYDQELARATAAPFLGKTGLAWAKSQAEITKSVLESNEKIGEKVENITIKSQAKDVTQDVMKHQIAVHSQLAGLLINQSQISSQIASSLTNLQQGQAGLLQLAANSSEALDEANRRERINRNNLLFQSAGVQIYVRGLY